VALLVGTVVIGVTVAVVAIGVAVARRRRRARAREQAAAAVLVATSSTSRAAVLVEGATSEARRGGPSANIATIEATGELDLSDMAIGDLSAVAQAYPVADELFTSTNQESSEGAAVVS
jgi:hypothetical protein